MPKHLVIVESPAKARTIERYLGDDYRVLASYGHVRDLPENPGKGKFGVDVDHDFAPEYVISEDRRKQVAAIEKAAKSADTVYLATDLDREGEAIAWHVAEAAHVPSSKTRRVTFNEITEGAIREAFANPREIDMNLVDAQQARRIVDRLVGYTLSPLLRARSAAACRPAASSRSPCGWSSSASARSRPSPRASTGRSRRSSRRADGETFAAELVRIDGKPLDVGDGETADAPRRRRCASSSPVVDSRSRTRQQKRSPAPPFTTRTLQQEASRKLGFSPKRTMSVAQRLYEGVDTPDGHVGLITYMRTDSTAIAGVAMGEARDVIGERYGEPYTMPKGRVYKTKSKGAQEAHESIRPTSFQRDPDSLAGVAQARGAAPVPPDLAARDRLADGAPRSSRRRRSSWRPAATSCARPRRGRCSTASRAVYTEGRDDGADEDDGADACRRSPRATSRRVARRHARPSTSPSRRRASPRRR